MYAYLLIGQDGNEAEVQLMLKPVGASFERSQGGTIMLTCEVLNNNDEADYNVKWFGDNNREISDTSGRSVGCVFSLPRAMIINYSACNTVNLSLLGFGWFQQIL